MSTPYKHRERFVIRKFCGGWHVWQAGGSLFPYWLSAHKTQAAAIKWATTLGEFRVNRLCLGSRLTTRGTATPSPPP